MPVRRPITGHPLLVATAGAFVACTGPSRHTPPVGNLMAPVEPVAREVCVRAVPAEATIVVDGAALAAQPCVSVERNPDELVRIEVSYPGYTTETIERPLGAIDGEILVELEATPAEPLLPPLEPRGNLMAPPPPPPRR